MDFVIAPDAALVTEFNVRDTAVSRDTARFVKGLRLLPLLHACLVGDGHGPVVGRFDLGTLQADIDGELNRRQLFAFEIPMVTSQLDELPEVQVLVTEDGAVWHPMDLAVPEPIVLVERDEEEVTPVPLESMSVTALAVVRSDSGRLPGPGKEPVAAARHVPQFSVQFHMGTPTHTGPAADYVAGLITKLTGVEHSTTIERSNDRELEVPEADFDLGGSKR